MKKIAFLNFRIINNTWIASSRILHIPFLCYYHNYIAQAHYSESHTPFFVALNFTTIFINLVLKHKACIIY
jgi:hypothetical protein